MTRTLKKLPAVILADRDECCLLGEGEITLKPLVPVLGLTLLERVIVTCREAGVDDFFIVVGRQKDKIIAHIDELRKKYGLSIRVVENPDWVAGSGTSVAVCSPYLSSPFFLLRCDRLFDSKILDDLRDADDGTTVCQLAVDRNVSGLGGREKKTMVRLDGEAIKAIGEGLQEPDAVATGFFLCYPLVFAALKKAQKQGDDSLWAAIRQLIDDGKVRAVDVSGSFWHGLDTAEALRIAKDRLLDRLKTAKLIDGPISRYINRFFSIKLTRRLAPYPITPNQISISSTVLGLLGASCFFGMGIIASSSSLAVWLLSGLAGFLIQMSSILDGVDGEIARLKHQTSPYGAYMDYMLDRYVDGLVVIGMVYASYMLTDSLTIVFAGFAALLGLPLSSIHRAKFLAESKRNYVAEDDGLLRYLPYSRDVRLFAIFLGGILNRVDLAIYFLAFVPNIVALLRLGTVKKAMKK